MDPGAVSQTGGFLHELMSGAGRRRASSAAAADLVLGDPGRGHPVAGFARLALAAERWIYRP